MYKVGDRVRFTFLGANLIGEILTKEVGGKFKVKGDNGTVYVGIYSKAPAKPKANVQVLGLIISKIS